MVYRGGVLGRWSQRSSDVWFQAVMLLGIFSAGWLACHPQVAWADSVTSVVTHAGVSGESLTWLLPCGRWSSSMGTVLTVTEPAGGLFGGITGYTSNMMTTLRLAVPDLCLQCAQVLWSSTIALTQMAQRFPHTTLVRFNRDNPEPYIEDMPRFAAFTEDIATVINQL